MDKFSGKKGLPGGKQSPNPIIFLFSFFFLLLYCPVLLTTAAQAAGTRACLIL
jgi:hypothetical protein